MPRRQRFHSREDSPPQDMPKVDPWTQPAALESIREGARADGVDEELLDGYVNVLTGIGDPLQDKRFGGSHHGLPFRIQRMPNYQAESRWRGSDLGARIVETIPDEMTREGFEVTVQPDSDDDDEPDEKADGFPVPAELQPLPPSDDRAPPVQAREPQPLELDEEGSEAAKALEEELASLGWDEVAYMAMCYERAYGGGMVFIGANDGAKSLTQPLDEKNIKSIDYLTAFSGGWDGEVVAWSYYRDIQKANYGQPEMYMVRNLGVPLAKVPAPGEAFNSQSTILPGGSSPDSYGSLIYWVHESRFIKFPGLAVSPRARVEMRGWGDSIFTRVDSVLRDFDQTWDGIANLMQSINQDVLGIKGLAGRLAAGNKKSQGDPLTNRARHIQRTRSLIRMLLIDQEEETFTRSTASLVGVADVLDRLILRLAAAADMPVDLLMGQAAAGGLNKGDTTLRFFYDRIRARQNRRLMRPLRHLLRLVQLAKTGPTKGVEAEKWAVTFRSLYQPTSLELAQERFQIAQTDQIYFNMGAITAAEITASRWGGAEYSSETQIDLQGRQEAAENEEASRDERRAAMIKAAKDNPQPLTGSPGNPSPDKTAGGIPQPAPGSPADDE